jgi:hypothetical protein
MRFDPLGTLVVFLMWCVCCLDHLRHFLYRMCRLVLDVCFHMDNVLDNPLPDDDAWDRVFPPDQTLYPWDEPPPRPLRNDDPPRNGE